MSPLVHEWAEAALSAVLLASRDAGVLALAVGGILLVCGRKIPPAWRHGLWLLVVVRLLLPALPGGMLSWQRLLPAPAPAAIVAEPTAPPVRPADSPPPPPLAGAMDEAPLPMPVPVASTASAVPTATPGDETLLAPAPDPVAFAFDFDWKRALPFVPFIWLAGVGGYLLLVSVLVLRFRRRVRALRVDDADEAAAAGELLARVVREQGCRRVPALQITRAVPAPAVSGLLRPEILLPPSTLRRLDETELRLVLLHELAHLRRRDLWLHWLLTLLQAVHWFNPVLWWAFHRLRVEAESAADAWALQRCGDDTPLRYGEALLRLLETEHPPRRVAIPGVVGVVESARDLRSRIRAIGRFSRRRNRLATVGAAALVVGLAAVGLTQAPKEEPEPVETPADTGKPSFTFTCSIRDEAGNPVSGAEVFFQLNSQPSDFIVHQPSAVHSSKYPMEVMASVSDAKGKATISLHHIEDLPKEIGGEWFARHGTKGIGTSGYHFIRFTSQPHTEELVLHKGAPMPLKVVDEAGLPIAGLRLRVAGLADEDGNGIAGFLGEELKDFWTATTDAEGECILPGVPNGKKIYVDHDDERYAQPEGRHHWEFRLAAGNTEPHVLRLEPTATISGRVLLPDGSPVAGALVNVLEAPGYERRGCSSETTTDVDGRYVLKRLFASRLHTRIVLPEALQGNWAQLVYTRISLGKGQHVEAPDTVLTPGALVTGRVTLPDTGQGVPNFSIGGAPFTYDSHLMQWRTRTDAEGYYRFRLPPGERSIYLAGFTPTGYRRPKEYRRDLILREGDQHVVDFILEKTSAANETDGRATHQDRSGKGSKAAVKKLLDSEKEKKPVDQPPQDQATAPTPADTGKLALTCLVRDEAGNPVSGAEVFFQPDLRQTHFGKYPAEVFTATTDGEGKAVLSVGSFESLPDPLGGDWFARHETKGMAASGYRFTQTPPIPLELVLRKGVPMPLKVVDDTGIPIAGLALRAVSLYGPDIEFQCHPSAELPDFWTATTDAKGECVIHGLPEQYRIYVDHADERYSQPEGRLNWKFQLVPGNAESHLLRLEPAATISGRVAFPDGSPVAGVMVAASEQFHYARGGHSENTTTDADGRYILKRLLASGYDINVTFPETLREDWSEPAYVGVSLEKGQAITVPDIVLTPGALVTGRVTLHDTGQGVPHFRIGAVSSPPDSHRAQRWGTTDAEGNYRLRLPAGDAKVYLAGEPPKGYSRPKGNERDLTLAEGGREVVDFTLGETSAMTGRVLDEDGKPVAGAALRARDSMWDTLKWLTGEDGTFRIETGDELDETPLIAFLDDQVSPEPVTAIPNGEAVEIRLRRNGFGRVEGRVIDESGNPLPGATAHWFWKHSIDNIRGEMAVDAEGRFRIERLLPEQGVLFSATADRHGSDSAEVDIEAGKTTTLPDLVLRKVGEFVAGRVVDARGEPVSNANVWVEGERQYDHRLAADGEGRFRIDGIVEGWLWVGASATERWRKIRIRSGMEDVVVRLPENSIPLKPEEIIDFTGKPAPPLRVAHWYHAENPDPDHKGKIRMIRFLGKERPLIHFSGTVELMQKNQDEFAGQGVEFLLVHGPWPTEEVEEILASDHPNLTVPLAIESEEGAMSDAFGVRHSLTVVIDREGKVVLQNKNGKGSKAAVQKLLDAEKEEKPAAQPTPQDQAAAPACMTVEGAANAEAFRAYVAEVLLPSLRPGDVLVMDNLSAHKNKQTLGLLAAAGVHTRFLPPYSPDINPIELMWSKLKSFLRAAGARTQEGLQEAITLALSSVTSKDAIHWFIHCGYNFI